MDGRPTLQRRSAIAFAVALLIHGLAAVWLFHLHRPPPPTPVKPKPIEFTLFEKKVTPLPPLPPEPPRPHKADKVKGPASKKFTEPVARDFGPPVPPPAGSPPAPPPRPTPEPPSEAPSTAPGNVKLFDEGALATRLGRPGNFDPDHGTGPVGRDGMGNSPGEEKARVTRRIENELTEQQATERVEMGLVDPYFREFAKATDKAWRITPKGAGGSEDTNQIKDFQALLTRWFSVGKTYGKTGNPHAGDGTVPTPDSTHPAGREAAAMDVAEFNAHWDAGKGFYVGGVLVLELTQDKEGAPLDIRVLRSSGVAELDASARKAVTLAAKQRLAPAHGLGLGGTYIFSLWKLEARVVPGGCSFIPDGTGKTGDLRFLPTSVQCGNNFDVSADGVKMEDPSIGTPFGRIGAEKKQRVITRVELLAVYGGETAPSQPVPGQPVPAELK